MRPKYCLMRALGLRIALRVGDLRGHEGALLGRPRNYHLRPFIGSAPLEAGAETLEEDGDDTGDQSKAIKASSHSPLTSMSGSSAFPLDRGLYEECRCPLAGG